MFTNSMTRLAVLTVALSSTFGAGCAADAASQRSTDVASTTRPTSTVTPPPAPATDAAAAERLAFVPEPVRFAYDQSALDDNGRAQLTALGRHLQGSPGVKVRVVGHADERGTPEYNMSLGDERARVARDYLVRMGISTDRILTSSRGEEEPAVTGGSESALAANRRDEFVLMNEVASR